MSNRRRTSNASPSSSPDPSSVTSDPSSTPASDPERQGPESVPLGVGGVSAAPDDHIAHFYRGADQRFSVLGPYVQTGLERGDRCVFISAPDVADELCTWLSAKGVDAEAAVAADRLMLDPGRATEDEMLRLASTVARKTQDDDTDFVRWAGDGGWALNDKMSVHEMLHWEALYDKHSSNWQMLALCQFDQTQFSGDVLMDALRSHPYCIMGNVVVPNPEHESPDTLLDELDRKE